LAQGKAVLTDQKLPGYRFPLSVIGHAVWLSHRNALSDRDVEVTLFERGVEVSRESVRTWRWGGPSRWCIHFSEEFAQNLRHREPRRGSLWHLDEMDAVVGGVTHWLWRAIDEHEAVLDVFLQRHRDTSAAASFFQRLLGEYDVPETVCADKLASCGAAIRELPLLDQVDRQRVISTARCNNFTE
jgi:putative transposase